MPVNKLDLSKESNSWLNALVCDSQNIINEYETLIKDTEYVEHFYLDNWKLLPIYSFELGLHKEIKYFPHIKKFIENIPKELTLMAITFSIIGYGDTAFHAEKWTNFDGFHRIHFPLRDVGDSSLFVKEDDGDVHEYGYDVGNLYEFENPYNTHKPRNNNKSRKNRIFIMFDYINTIENPNVDFELVVAKNKRAIDEFIIPPNLLPPL